MWRFMDPGVPCPLPPHRLRPGRHTKHATAAAHVHPHRPTHTERGPPPPETGKCQPPVARGAATGRPLRPDMAGPSKPPYGGWEPLVFWVPLQLCWCLGRVDLKPET